MPRCSLLVTGFEPFGGWPGNPTVEAVRHLAARSDLRRLGMRTGVLPVKRRAAPASLLTLLRRHQPRMLVMTGLAVGRRELCVERLAVNCWRPAGDRGAGRPILKGGPDGLFATLPLEVAVEALGSRGEPAVISESAGTFCCNLVLYKALLWSRSGELPGGGRPPEQSGFIHVPPTAACLPPGRVEPCLPEDRLHDALGALCDSLLRSPPSPRGRPG